MDEDHVPAALARLWRLGAESRLGRPARLDVDRVVRAAVELADRDGLSGVTLPKVAESLGVTKMSLYRYVGSKGELLDLMADFAQGPVPHIDADIAWRDGLRQWATASAETMLGHHWLSEVPVTGPPSGPNGIGWFDLGLRQLRHTGLSWGMKTDVILVLNGHVRSGLQLNQGFEERRRHTGADQVEVEREYGRNLAMLVEPQRFPDAAALFRSGMLQSLPDRADGTLNHDFHFGLELILDGIAVAVADIAAA